MADELNDANQLAHRIVEQATGDEGPPCPECGLPMVKRQAHASKGRFGSDRPDVRISKTYYVCPNGHEVHAS
jgi:hypothetical protein